MTVGTEEAFRYIVIHPGKHDVEATNPGALFVALSRAESAGGEGVDPDFAFHEGVLLNDDRLKPVNTPTTRPRAVEMERLHVLATQCQEREALAPAYRDGTFLRLVEVLLKMYKGMMLQQYVKVSLLQCMCEHITALVA